MKFGIYALPTYFAESDGSINQFYDNMISFLVESDELGFDSLWLNEHHFHPFGGMIPQPAVILAMLAGRTKKIRLGTSVSLLPLHHPIDLAESFAMVDQMSGGRLEFGIGTGFAVYDFEVLGVPFEDRDPRMKEALDIILKAWTEQPFTHHSEHYHYENLNVFPTPLQKPYPPIWSAATRNPETYKWIGSKGYNLLTVAYVKPLDELAELINVYREAAKANGHEADRLQVASHFQIYCSHDGNEARKQAAEALQNYLAISKAARSLAADLSTLPKEKFDFNQLVEEGRIVAGTPQECIQLLERAVDKLGLTQIDCTFYFGGIPYEKASASFRLFAQEVMPHFKSIRTEGVSLG